MSSRWWISNHQVCALRRKILLHTEISEVTGVKCHLVRSSHGHGHARRPIRSDGLRLKQLSLALDFPPSEALMSHTR